MLLSEVRVDHTKMTKIALALVAAVSLAVAQEGKPADTPQKVAKDDAEAALINSIVKETDAAKRLASLEEWSKKYPETQFADERDTYFLITYNQLQKKRESFDKAAQ